MTAWGPRRNLDAAVLLTLLTCSTTLVASARATNTPPPALASALAKQSIKLNVHYCCPDVAIYNSTAGSCDVQRTDVDWMPPWTHRNGTRLNLGVGTIYTLITGFPRCSALIFEPDKAPGRDDFLLLPSGSIFFPYNNQSVSSDRACIVEVATAAASGHNEPLHYAVVCYDSIADSNASGEGGGRAGSLSYALRTSLYSSAMAVSEVFLALTLLCYWLVPELRDLQGRTIVCTIVSLMVSFLVYIIVVTMGNHVGSGVCLGLGVLLHYWMMTSFFWLSAVSITAFYLATKKSNLSMEEEKRPFTYLNLFSWLTPLLFTLTAVIVDYSPLHPDYTIKPNFGAQWCWFGNRSAELAYFFGPVTLLLLLNIALFVATIVLIYRQSGDGTRKLDSNGEHKKKNSIKMCLKLFVVMGITWIFEILQFFLKESTGIWIFFDMINILQGVFIFIAVILSEKEVRQRVSQEIIKRVGNKNASDVTRLEDQIGSYTPSEEIS